MDKMLQPPSLQMETYAPAESLSFSEVLERSTGFIRRQFAIIVFVLASVLGLGSVYFFTTPSQYTANAYLLIDTSKTRALQQQAVAELPLDSTQVETQVEVIKSESIALSVIRELKLTDDPEFVGQQTGLVGVVLDTIMQPFLSGEAAPSEDDLSRRALRRFLRNRDVRRVSRTYVLNISYTSRARAQAAAVANAIAEAYIVDQLDSKYQATRRASKWLQDS